MDAAAGIREFIIGTGGDDHHRFATTVPGSEVRNGTDFGVLRLALRADGYDWQFLPADGGPAVDSGTAATGADARRGQPRCTETRLRCVPGGRRDALKAVSVRSVHREPRSVHLRRRRRAPVPFRPRGRPARYR